MHKVENVHLIMGHEMADLRVVVLLSSPNSATQARLDALDVEGNSGADH